MGRGFGALAQPTGKCKCENPKWAYVPGGVQWINNGTKLRYTLRCTNCGKWWHTESRDARKYFNLDAPISPGGKSHNTKTYGQLFAEGDAAYLKYLEMRAASALERAESAAKELHAAQNALSKFISVLAESDSE